MFVAYCWLLVLVFVCVVGYLRFVVNRCLLSVVCCFLLIVVCCSLLITFLFVCLRVACCVLSVVRSLLFVVSGLTCVVCCVVFVNC